MRRSLVLLGALLGACGDSQPSDHADMAAPLAAGGAASSNGAGGAGACQGTEARLSDAVCLEEVTGSVVNEQNEPASELEVTVCGPICFPGRTDESGRFVVEVNRYVLASEYSVQPHGTPDLSTFYYRLPDDFSGGGYDSGVLQVTDLRSVGEALIVKTDKMGAPAQTVSAGDITISIPEGTFAKLSLRDVAHEEGHLFRSRRVPEELAMEFSERLQGWTTYALGPFETRFELEDTRELGRATLAVDNTADWAPQTEIEVSALGTYLEPEWLPPAEFAPIGVARVSEDGTQVVLPRDAEGPGLSWLTWIAMRPR